MDLVPEAASLSSKPFPLQVLFTKPVASCNKNVPQGLKALILLGLYGPTKEAAEKSRLKKIRSLI
jgi:hypothetical protein